MIKVITYTLLILLIGKPGISQIRTEIDSLHHKLENADQDTSRVILMTDLGYWYLSINPDSSMMFGNRALVLAQQIKYLRGQARSLATLGNTTRFLGDIPKGMELLFDGLQISKKYDFPFESALCLNDIGVIYADELQDYSKALIYFSQARLFYNRAHHNTMEEKYGIFFDIDAGISYQQTGQLDSSLFYRQRSLNKAISLQSGPYPVTLMMMGDLQFEMGNPKLAMEYLHESIRVNQKSFDPRTAAEAYNSLAGYFRIMKQPDSSVFYAKKALADAQSINHKQAILKASILLAGLYESANIDEAYKYLKIARIVNEELYGARKVQNLQRLISTQQERQRETEAAKIAYQNQLKQYALLAGLGIMFLFGFILYRNDRQKQKANKVLVATLSNLKSTQSQLIQSE
ncbi:MAG TPA: hypothetical protein DGG95_07660, partial [Cytophagales bacterium]|nr:hypothetical protein [Cytophagales bacterium]